ncbi:hypothetical protein [Stutzerimonas xanthomarina]|jgi:branched-subunit amino acid transport protein AzlD|uniref:hypothetical protein n=1 Tax=Stutzerimonas xanthomarina TaxID=271420 RepID=UPI00190A7978|nr:hypothetical protein [Stutzerimonas xanthomarina]|tara:strand:+ start:1207 stop:1458 length:252 start_codon:yes stop_codon:yes gene_type:complete
MTTSVLLAIAALFATSCLVRILPVFVSIDLTDTTRRLLERVLPTAVFINFAVYILYSEATRRHWLPGLRWHWLRASPWQRGWA